MVPSGSKSFCNKNAFGCYPDPAQVNILRENNVVFCPDSHFDCIVGYDVNVSIQRSIEAFYPENHVRKKALS